MNVIFKCRLIDSGHLLHQCTWVIHSISNIVSVFAGSFADKEGSVDCDQCTPGTFRYYDSSIIFPFRLPLLTVSNRQNYVNNQSELLILVTWLVISQSGTSISSFLLKITPNFSADSGASVCDNCDPGTFTADFGQRACSNCKAGTFADLPGQRICEDCHEGFFSVRILNI